MFIYCLKYINNVLYVAFPDRSVGKKKKNPSPAMQEIPVRFLDQDDQLEKG